MKEELLKELRELTEAFGPSGCEDSIAALIEQKAAPWADEIRRDAMGSLIVHKKGSGKRILFSAHMDSVGMMATRIDGKGYVYFSEVGGLVATDLSRHAVVFENGTMGVVGVPENKEEKLFEKKELYIDIGCDSREEAAKKVAPGDCAVYQPVFFTQGDRIFANYLDNRSGCLLLLEVLRRVKGDNDLYFVFSVQEEVGMRGAKPAAYGIDPEIAIGVDVTCPDDLPGTTHTCTAMTGAGAAIKVMDHSVHCDPVLTAQLEQLGREKGIPVQLDIMKFGGTDAGAIQPTRSGVVTGGVSIPCRYTHAPVEMLDGRDFDACADLLTAFAEN